MISLALVTVESVRVSGLRFQLELAASSAADSAFAEYDTGLQSAYGLLFYPEGKQQLERTAQSYSLYYADPRFQTAKDVSLGSFFGLGPVETVCEEAVFASDEGGLVFEREAVRSLGPTAAEKLAEELLSRWDLVGSAGGFLRKIKEIQLKTEDLLGLEKKYQAVKKAYRELLKVKEEASEAASQAQKVLEAIRRFRQERTEKQPLREQIEALIEEGRQDLSAAYRTVLEDCREQVRGVFAEAQEEALSRLEEAVGGLLRPDPGQEPESGQDPENGQDPGQESGPASGVEDGQESEARKGKQELWQQITRLGEELFPAEAGSTEEEQKARAGRSFLDRVRELREKGILAFVTAGDVSARQISREDLPSRTIRKDGDGTAAEDTLFVFYLLGRMPCYADGTGAYDLEYVLGRSETDAANLRTAAEELLAVREALDLAYLYSDTAKRTEARQLAALICEMTGLPVLTPAAELLILAGWAFCESVTDVRRLMSGERVCFWKSPSTWKTSLQGLLRETAFSGSGSDPAGISYKEYLAALLLLRDPFARRVRAMDVIEWNMDAAGRRFRFSDCISQAGLSFTCRPQTLFFRAGTGLHLSAAVSMDYAGDGSVFSLP